MEITFLIGNGFDLNLGLKTTYLNFIEQYKRSNLSDTQNIVAFKNYINDNEDLWSYAELEFGRYTQMFENTDKGAKAFCECHEDFCVKLADYLTQQDNLLDNYNINEGAKLFAKSISSYYSSFRDVQKTKISALTSSIGGGFIYNFINFNYTFTLDKFANATKSDFLQTRKYEGTNYVNTIGNIYHIHGDTHSDMVLGLDNEDQIANNKLFENSHEIYKSQIIKSYTNRLSERLIDESVINLMNISNVFYIYGMSTGATDLRWWKLLGKIMIERKSVRVIIHSFGAPQRGLISTKYNLYIDSIKDSFVKNFECNDTQKAELKKRIHIDTTNIFESLHNFIENDLYKVTDKKLVVASV